MKLYNKIIFGAFLSLSLASCLKDKDYDDRITQAQRPDGGAAKVIELGVTSTSTSNFLQFALSSSEIDTVINIIPVSVVTGPASQDIHVTLVNNPALIGNYNALNGTIHEDAPAAVYSIVNPASADATGYVVTIPKGSSKAFLQIKVKKSDFLGHDYAFGFSIGRIEESGYLISSNLSTGIVAIGIKNKYDGVYTVSGTLVDVQTPANSSTAAGPYPYEVYLITTGANSVTMFIPGGGYFHYIAGGSVYGEFDPVFNFDATGAITSVTNYYGDPSPTRVRSAAIDPSGLNVYNADQSIDVKYFINQGGVLKGRFDEHLEYTGPRP